MKADKYIPYFPELSHTFDNKTLCNIFDMSLMLRMRKKWALLLRCTHACTHVHSQVVICRSNTPAFKLKVVEFTKKNSCNLTAERKFDV